MDKTSRRKQELMVAMDNRKKQKTLTVEIYKGLKKQKVIDARIMEKYGFNTVNFTKWKHDNGLIVKSANRKPQQAVQSTIEDKGDECMSEGQSAVEVDYKAKYEALKVEKELLKSAHVELTNNFDAFQEMHRDVVGVQNDTLQRMQQELADVQSTLGQQSRQVDQEEYLKLVVDFTDLEEENDRLKRMLERLKNTERMNLWMMEQYVGLYEQVDEVMA